MQFIIDTGVLVSAFIYPGSMPDKALYKAVAFGQLIFTEPTYDELTTVLYRKKFDHYTTAKLREKFLDYISEAADFISITTSIRLCRDPKDDKLLEAAFHGNVSYLITGDTELLVLHPFRHTAIVTPADFLKTAL